MYISMHVVKRGGGTDVSTFDVLDIQETGQTVGEALGTALDMELSYPDTAQVSVIITKEK